MFFPVVFLLHEDKDLVLFMFLSLEFHKLPGVLQMRTNNCLWINEDCQLTEMKFNFSSYHVSNDHAGGAEECSFT